MRVSGRALVARATAVAVLLAAAGCSSSTTTSTTTTSTGSASTTGANAAVYSLKPTQACLNTKRTIHAYRNNGNTVVNGSRGELRVTFGPGRQWVYLAFGRTADEAKAIEQRAVAAALAHDKDHILNRATVLAGVRRKGNVFYYSDGGPVQVLQSTPVDSCLQ